MNRPYPWLKFASADEINDPDITFSGCPVMSPMGEKLGTIDGFILDSTTGRPYYVVVDAGGWFRARNFLLPIGHASIATALERPAIVADLSRDRIRRFPGFDKQTFDAMTPDTLKSLNDQICVACSIETIDYPAAEPYDAAWARPDYGVPDWWNSEPTLPQRMGDRAFSEGVDYPSPADAETAAAETRSNWRAATHSQ